MQKSKIATICLIIIIFIYSFLENTFIKNFENIYILMINPIFWITFSIFLIKVLCENFTNKIIEKESIIYTIVFSLIYVILNLLLGLIVGFTNNPYLNTFNGVIINCWVLGIPIICREIIRYKIVNNVYKNDKRQICFLVVIVFTLIDGEIWNLFSEQISIIYVFEKIVKVYLLIIMENILLTYLASIKNVIAMIIYKLIYNLYLWISPILPNIPWIIDMVLLISTQVLLIIYIESIKLRFNKNSKRSLIYKPTQIVIFVIFTIIFIFFIVGIFPIKPVAIASGSMEKELLIGDVVLIKKCEITEINVGDIIEFQSGEKTIIHRVKEKKFVDEEFYLITQGDNNASTDNEPVTQNNLIGKCVFKIRKIGYPAVWLNNLIKN